MEHQTGSYPFAKYMTQQFSQLIKGLSVAELPQLISILNMEISNSGLRLENLKGMSTGSHLTLHQCAIVGDKFMRKLEQGDAGCKD